MITDGMLKHKLIIIFFLYNLCSSLKEYLYPILDHPSDFVTAYTFNRKPTSVIIYHKNILVSQMVEIPLVET